MNLQELVAALETVADFAAPKGVIQAYGHLFVDGNGLMATDGKFTARLATEHPFDRVFAIPFDTFNSMRGLAGRHGAGTVELDGNQLLIRNKKFTSRLPITFEMDAPGEAGEDEPGKWSALPEDFWSLFSKAAGYAESTVGHPVLSNVCFDGSYLWACDAVQAIRVPCGLKAKPFLLYPHKALPKLGLTHFSLVQGRQTLVLRNEEMQVWARLPSVEYYDVAQYFVDRGTVVHFSPRLADFCADVERVAQHLGGLGVKDMIELSWREEYLHASWDAGNGTASDLRERYKLREECPELGVMVQASRISRALECSRSAIHADRFLVFLGEDHAEVLSLGHVKG